VVVLAHFPMTSLHQRLEEVVVGLLVLVVMEQLYPSAALRPVHILVA
jgi:hypothetical protein